MSKKEKKSSALKMFTIRMPYDLWLKINTLVPSSYKSVNLLTVTALQNLIEEEELFKSNS